MVTAIALPLTFSIAHGRGIGFIATAAVKVLSGKEKDCLPAVYVTALPFALKFALLWTTITNKYQKYTRNI